MAKGNVGDLFDLQQGIMAPDAYSTAWIALVPQKDEANHPAWPQALTYLRQRQLTDGGWGDAEVYNAHDRTICTLATMHSLLEWGESTKSDLIERAVRALHKYAPDLAGENHEMVGFELSLPRLVRELDTKGISLRIPEWTAIMHMGIAKIALIGDLTINYETPRVWWFTLETLPEIKLAQIDKRILNEDGSVMTSTAATAAYLRALRLSGNDSPRAEAFLERVLQNGDGGAGFCYPIERFELIWTLDNLLMAGLSPEHSHIAQQIQHLADAWSQFPKGLSFSRSFPINDGDDTSVGYQVLRKAGLNPTYSPLHDFWDKDHFRSYLDERTPSVTANIHAMSALRQDVTSYPKSKQMAILTTEWLRKYLTHDLTFSDKWHVSPIYSASHAIYALANWDNELAKDSLEIILANQQDDGGWGFLGQTTVEETGHAILGLVAAYRAGLLQSKWPLIHAKRYMDQHYMKRSSTRLWIGKTLYHPIGVVESLVYSARVALEIEGIENENGRFYFQRVR